MSKFRIHLFSGIIHGNCILRFYSLLCFYHLFLVWGIARTISVPIQHLCLQIQRINGETDAQIQDSYSLNELEALKRSYNQMEEMIRRSEEEKDSFSKRFP